MIVRMLGISRRGWIAIGLIVALFYFRARVPVVGPMIIKVFG